MAQHGKKWSYYSIASLPRPLDIVWCHFPIDEMPGVPAPRARPALVRCVLLAQGHTHAFVEVTYGTSNLKIFQRRRVDLIIQNDSELCGMGLPQATRFDLERTVTLPWASEFFVGRTANQSPVIGHLSKRYCEMLGRLTRRRVAAS